MEYDPGPMLQVATFELAVDQDSEEDLLEIAEFLKTLEIAAYAASEGCLVVFDEGDHEILQIGRQFSGVVGGRWHEVRLELTTLDLRADSSENMFRRSLLLDNNQFALPPRLIEAKKLTAGSPLTVIGETALLVMAVAVLLCGGKLTLDWKDNELKVRGQFNSLIKAIADFRLASSNINRVTRDMVRAAERVKSAIEDDKD